MDVETSLRAYAAQAIWCYRGGCSRTLWLGLQESFQQQTEKKTKKKQPRAAEQDAKGVVTHVEVQVLVPQSASCCKAEQPLSGEDFLRTPPYCGRVECSAALCSTCEQSVGSSSALLFGAAPRSRNLVPAGRFRPALVPSTLYCVLATRQEKQSGKVWHQKVN